MDRGLISPDWEPLRKLLHSLLLRVRTDLTAFGPVGLSVSSGPSDALVVLASLEPGGKLVEAQGRGLGGPLLDAVATGLPVAVADIWTDSRWPRLTLRAVTEVEPELAPTWAQIRGVAVMPAGHDDHSMVALSCSLTRSADERTLHILARYRQLLESAIAITRATGINGTENVLNMLQSRAIIEQAKGAIMAASTCSPDQAWNRLRTASQQHNVKLRDIATALVEQLSKTRAEHPEGLPEAVVDPAAYDAAVQLWKSLF